MNIQRELLAKDAALGLGSEVLLEPKKTPGDRSGIRRLTFVFVLLFYSVYFLRPQDVFPPLASLPIAKIFGVIAILTMILGLLARVVRVSREIVLLALFLFYLCLTIPFSIWPGGAFTVVVFGAAKAILIPIAAIGVLTTVDRLRRLLLFQTIAMLALTLAALAHYSGGRMFGIGSMFGDPNEFALDICIVLPVCVARWITTRSILLKIFWTSAVVVSLLAIILTYSRGGFLALLVVCIVLPWRFRFNVLSTVLLAVFGSLLLVGAVLIAGPSSYIERIQTITNADADATGSAALRQELLMASIRTTLRHPIFGVGPGQFMQVSGSWHQSHNTYTQISSDAGIPALIIFLVLMGTSLRNVGRVRSMVPRDEFWYLSAAIHCGILAYLVGGTFLSTAFWFIPYLLVAYTAAVAKIAESRQEALDASVEPYPINDQSAYV